jgi:aminoglycoside 3-N-acetyltransferase
MVEVMKSDLLAAFRDAGMGREDTLLVFSNLARVGKVKDAASKADTLRTYLDALLETIDVSRGTLVVPTFTYSFARGTPFYHEESPSELCMLGEFVRRQSESLRSFHPHFSFCAIGREKREICRNVSRSAFGYESVFDRLYKKNAKMVFIGTNITEGLTFHLYIEHMVGLSHCYHKAYFTPAFRDGYQVEGPFFSYVRHLVDGLRSDLSPFEAELRGLGLIREVEVGAGRLQVVQCHEVFREGYRRLQADPCYFYSREFYVTE